MGPARRGLCLERELRRVGLVEVVPGPQVREKVEAELAPDGRFDDLAVALAVTGGTHLDGPQHVLVDRERRTRLRHLDIIASPHHLRPWPVNEDRRRMCQTPFDARSEEHTTELQSLMRITSAVLCLKKKR